MGLQEPPQGHPAGLFSPHHRKRRAGQQERAGLAGRVRSWRGLSLTRCVLPPSQAPYFNCIFLHEGWPLCLHEKVVVHLAPLNPLLLRPGDFYLQAEPCEEHSARITVKHLSRDLRSVEETPVPEAAYALLFTNEWLEEINGDRARAPLHTCLVATENGVAPLPWSKIATPEFIDKPKAGDDGTATGARHGHAPEPAGEPAAPSTPVPCGTADTPVSYGNVVGTIPGCKVTARKSSQGRYPGLIKVDQAGLRKKPATLAMPSLCEIISQNLEGEYVNLLELSQQQLDLLARSLPPARPARPMGAGAEAMLPWENGGPGAEPWPCAGAQSSEEGHCTPCLGRKLSQELGPHSPRCRHRDSYLAALQNPVSFGPGLMAAILEEPDGPKPPPATPRETPTQHGTGAGSPTLLTRRPHRASPGAQTEAPVRQGSPRLPPGSSHKFSFLKGPRLGVAPGDERASSQHEGAWKKVSAIYSPRMGRAKPAGKGIVRAGLQRLPGLRGGFCISPPRCTGAAPLLCPHGQVWMRQPLPLRRNGPWEAPAARTVPPCPALAAPAGSRQPGRTCTPGCCARASCACQVRQHPETRGGRREGPPEGNPGCGRRFSGGRFQG